MNIKISVVKNFYIGKQLLLEDMVNRELDVLKDFKIMKLNKWTKIVQHRN